MIYIISLKPRMKTAALQVPAWYSAASQDVVREETSHIAALEPQAAALRLLHWVSESRRIHDVDGINLNPASNVMNPRAEKLLSMGLGSRASLGHPGDKYEMGLQAIERIEIQAAELAAEVFAARFAEVRVGSGALANLYVFMAICKPGDTIIAPPAEIGGHVTHHGAGAAGLYGLNTVAAPVLADGYTVDIDGLRTLAQQIRPKLITLGGSLNLFPHPVAQAREIADSVGAKLMFDAAHLCGMIAGGAWANPLTEGAHVMTMSTYKSLGGPVGGLLVTNDAALAERIDAIAYPGLTANFDPGRVAALAMTLLDWKAFGHDYARAMQDAAKALADQLSSLGLEVFADVRGATQSHQLALLAHRWGGGQNAARRMERAGLLACGIGLPTQLVPAIPGEINGLRLGVPEIVRLGMGPQHMPRLAELIKASLGELSASAIHTLREEVQAFRAQFQGVHYVLS